MKSCSKCHKPTALVYKEDRTRPDQPLKIQPIPREGLILDGKLWNGKDVVNVGRYFITKRMLNWLQAVHAFPYIAKPARFCTDGMSEEPTKPPSNVALHDDPSSNSTETAEKSMRPHAMK